MPAALWRFIKQVSGYGHLRYRVQNIGPRDTRSNSAFFPKFRQMLKPTRSATCFVDVGVTD